MTIDIDKLLIYRSMDEMNIIKDVSWLMNNYSDPVIHTPYAQNLLYDAFSKMIRLSYAHGLSGDIWKNHVLFQMLLHENVFSLSSELKGCRSEDIKNLAIHDFEIIKDLYHFDFSLMDRVLENRVCQLIRTFNITDESNVPLDDVVIEAIRSLSAALEQADTAMQFYMLFDDFYKKFGCGIFSMYIGYKLDQTELQDSKFIPIKQFKKVFLDDIIGYESQKQSLYQNTLAFVQGERSNNVLLYGDSGTGKSTSIKAIANTFFSTGLRIIELYKHQLQNISTLLSVLRERPYRFLIYMDDLSFEEQETEYKYLKAVIEGGLEACPENVLVYATSNRKHFIREFMQDNLEYDTDLHRSETKEEKISLSSRFGLTLPFFAPNKKNYQEIAFALAKRHNIQMDREEFLKELNRWEVRHSGRSGRGAEQFIFYLLSIEMS